MEETPTPEVQVEVTGDVSTETATPTTEAEITLGEPSTAVEEPCEACQ